MSAFDNTIPVNEATFNQVNEMFLMEYERTPNLNKLCLYVASQASSYRWDFQEKVNFVDVSPGSALQRTRPSVRQVTATPQPKAARLSSDIFTQATLKETEITNFISLLLEALHRSTNQLMFTEVDTAQTAGALPDDHIIGTAVDPITFDVDHLLRVNKILSNEGATGGGMIYVVGPNEQESLLQDERYASAFYNTVRPLPGGMTMAEFKAVGITLITIPAYPSQSEFVQNGKLETFTTGGGGTKVFAMAKNTFGSFFNKVPEFKTWYDDNTLSWIVDCCYQGDVSLLRPNGLIITYSATVA